MSTQWTASFMDGMRQQGDALADEVVASLFTEQGVGGVNGLMGMLVANDGLPSEQLPPVVRDYLAQTSAAVPKLDLAKIQRGEEVFASYGPEILMILGCYSLPAAYAAKKGVQVLYRTAYLLQRPVRRLFETTQMVVDVMSPGGLGPEGKGLRTTQKVRLIHAANRHLITHDSKRPWDTALLGVPINQEDLAGTLTTFTTVVMDGLNKLGIQLIPEEEEAFLYAWSGVADILGLDPALRPATVPEAYELARIIHLRQLAECPEGRAMTSALIEAMQGLSPRPFKGLPAVMIRHFLEKDVFTHQDVATMIGVPPASQTGLLEEAILALIHALGALEAESPTARKVLRTFSLGLINAMLLVEHGGKRAPFSITEHLMARWKPDARVVAA